MAPFSLSRDGACPHCQSWDVAYVLQPRHFAAGILAPVFRILLKTNRAIIGLEQLVSVTEYPSMICCGQCVVTSSLRGCFNLDWRFTNLHAAFSLTRDMVQDEEREPVDMRQLMERGQQRLQQLRPVFPNTAPTVDSDKPCRLPATTEASPSSLQDTIASALRSVRRECEVRVPYADGQSKSSRKPSSTGEKRSRWSSATVKNMSLRDDRHADSGEHSAAPVLESSPQKEKWKSFCPVDTIPESRRPPVDLAVQDDASEVPAPADAPPLQLSPSTDRQMTGIGSNSVQAACDLVDPTLANDSVGDRVGVGHEEPTGCLANTTGAVQRPDLDRGASRHCGSSSTGTEIDMEDEDAEDEEGEVANEPEACPEGISSTVWQFYQHRVLNPKSSKSSVTADYSSPQRDPSSTVEGDVTHSEAERRPEVTSADSWNDLNVQEILRASDASFTREFDQRAAKLRVAALRRKAARAMRAAGASDAAASDPSAYAPHTVSSVLMSQLSDSSATTESQVSAVSGADNTNLPSDQHTSKGEEACMPACTVQPSDTVGSGELTSMADRGEGAGGAVEAQCFEGADVQEQREASTSVTTASHRDISACAASSDVSTRQAEPALPGPALPASSSPDLGHVEPPLPLVTSISASPDVGIPSSAGDLPRRSYSSLAAGSSSFRYPYGAVLASSANKPLATIVPLEEKKAPVNGGGSSVSGTLANPAISLPNLVVYSSDEDEEAAASPSSSNVCGDEGSDKDDIDNADDGCEGMSPSQIDGWVVVDEASEEVDRATDDHCLAGGGSVMSGDGSVDNDQIADADATGSGETGDATIEGEQQQQQPVYPVSMTGACPYCYSSDVVYIVLCPEAQPDSTLPPLIRNLLLCGCAKKLPPPTDGQEVPSFQCHSCSYGFNLNWVATSLEAIFGVNDEPVDLDALEPATSALSSSCAEPVSGGEEEEDKEEEQPKALGKEDDGWDIYWQQLTPRQRADYERWHVAHTREQEQAAVKPVPDVVPEQVDCAADTEKKARDLAAKTERQLLALQPEGVRQFEALLSHIDEKKENLPTSGCAQASSAVGKRAWWRLVAEPDLPGQALSPKPDEVTTASGDAAPADCTSSISQSHASPSSPVSTAATPAAVSLSGPTAEAAAGAPRLAAAVPSYVTKYEDYSVQGSFNPYTGKFQRNADLEQSDKSDDHGIRHMQHHFNTSELVVGPDEPAPKKPKLTRKEVEKMKAKKSSRKRQSLLRANGI